MEPAFNHGCWPLVPRRPPPSEEGPMCGVVTHFSNQSLEITDKELKIEGATP